MASSVDASTNAITHYTPVDVFLAVLVKPLKLCVLPSSGVLVSWAGPFASANKPE